jgi:hypothetical protein
VKKKKKKDARRRVLRKSTAKGAGPTRVGGRVDGWEGGRAQGALLELVSGWAGRWVGGRGARWALHCGGWAGGRVD